jgi:hypothetical protein
VPDHELAKPLICKFEEMQRQEIEGMITPEQQASST